MSQQVCPNCQTRLQPSKVSEGVVWTCDGCGGLWANVALLRRHSDKGVANGLWRTMRTSSVASQQRCPGCARAMTEFGVEKVADPGTTVVLTGCPGCQAFWFDGGELEQLRLSFSGPVRESTRIPPPTPMSADWRIPEVGIDIFDGFDFGCSD